MPQCILGASNQRYLEGAEEVRDGLAWFGLNLVWFIVTVLLFLYGSFIFPVHDNLCFVTSWIRLLHFDIACLLEMSAFVVTLGEFVTAVSKRILLNKLTATLSICSEAPGIGVFFNYLFEHIERHTSLVLLVFC